MAFIRKTVLKLSLASLAALSLTDSQSIFCSAHGYIQSPRSRNFVAYQDGLWWGGGEGDPEKEDCPHCLNLGGTLARCGLTAGRNYDEPKNALGGPMPVNIQASYTEGEEMEVDIVLTAHHMGHFVFKACPINPGEVATQDCFDTHPLTFVKDLIYGANQDVNYPERAYIAPSSIPGAVMDYSGVGGMKFSFRLRLPLGLHGPLVLLQWHYLTANSCVYEGYGGYNWPEAWGPGYGSGSICTDVPPDGNGVPEQFWNCAELSISQRLGGTPTQVPTNNTPTSVPTQPLKTTSPTMSPTRTPSISKAPTPPTKAPAGTNSPTEATNTNAPSKNPTKQPTSTPTSQAFTSAPTKAPTATLKGINSPAITLTVADLQVALDRYNSLQGDNQVATQSIIDTINSVTATYSLYRQLAFVAHTIWESGGYQYNEEIAAVTPPYTARDSYQTCDWGTGEQASNGQVFYGRGYIQLSWCANYKSYGQNRMINGDPDYFYNNPDEVATTYAMDSAAWYFESVVGDNTGQFGKTTADINGPIECNGNNNFVGSIPQKRWQIFDALASRIGLSGYSEGGCYNESNTSPTDAPTKAPTVAPNEVPSTTPPPTPTTTTSPSKKLTSSPTASSGSLCPPGYTGLKATEDCTGFVHCADGDFVAGPQYCQTGTGLLFDESCSCCNYASQVNCGA